MNKKGILLTLSFVTLGTILFSVAFLISYNENEAEQGVKELIILDKLYHKHIYLSNGIRNIFNQDNATNIIFDNNFIEFNIDNDILIDFKDDIDNFIGIAELLDESISFSLDSSNLGLIIQPYNINYSHPYSNDDIIINLKDALGLNITMDIDDDDATESWTWHSSTSGEFNFSAQIISTGSDEITSDRIDISAYNFLYINTTLGNVTIEINNYIMTIENGAEGGSTTTRIFLNNTDVSVVIPKAYTITSYNSQFTGNIQIAEN